jgi:hypothetical protein
VAIITVESVTSESSVEMAASMEGVPSAVSGTTMSAPAMTTPAMTTPAMTTPAMTTPAMTTPAMTTPAMANPSGCGNRCKSGTDRGCSDQGNDRFK